MNFSCIWHHWWVIYRCVNYHFYSDHWAKTLDKIAFSVCTVCINANSLDWSTFWSLWMGIATFTALKSGFKWKVVSPFKGSWDPKDGVLPFADSYGLTPKTSFRSSLDLQGMARGPTNGFNPLMGGAPLPPGMMPPSMLNPDAQPFTPTPPLPPQTVAVPQAVSAPRPSPPPGRPSLDLSLKSSFIDCFTYSYQWLLAPR